MCRFPATQSSNATKARHAPTKLGIDLIQTAEGVGRFGSSAEDVAGDEASTDGGGNLREEVAAFGVEGRAALDTGLAAGSDKGRSARCQQAQD